MDPDLLNNPRLLYILQRAIEKEIIRHEIIAAEIERRRLPEEEVRRELMIERETAMHRSREMGLSIEDRLLMLLHTRYPSIPFPRNLGLGFGHDVLPSTLPHFSHGLWSGLDVNKKDELTMPGKPNSNICGPKQKAATSPAGSGGLPSTSSNKPKKWSCALCQVSATTDRSLYVHLQGKKHKAKINLLRDLKMFLNSTSKKSNESRDSGGQEMKTKVQEESVEANKTVFDLDQKVEGGLNGHRQCKTHKAKVARLLRGKKMCRNFTSSMSKKSTESRGGAGQKMKTKVQVASVKANKTVVGLNQKVKGGLDGHSRRKKHKAKVARLLRDKKMCSNSSSSTSKKSTESTGGAGQQEESVKADKIVVGLNQKVKSGLHEHPQGKKHKAKVAKLLRDKKMCSNSTSSMSKKATENIGSAGLKKEAKVQEESIKATKIIFGLNQKVRSGLNEHPQGKKHRVKEELLGSPKWNKKSTESRDSAGQEMKSKVEENLVKANKTVVDLDQKEKGDQAQQVKPYPNPFGSKQEAATLPADSGKLRLMSLKKPMHWSCALCQVNATSKRDLDAHLRGKKHKAKEEELPGAQKWTKESTKSRDSAGQEMKTKGEEESIKANKTLVDLDQKGEGGRAQQVRPYPNLCGSKQEAATLPAAPGKLRLTCLKEPMHWSSALCQVSATSKRERLRRKKHKAKAEELLGAQKWTKISTASSNTAGQKMKTKVEEESVKANTTVVGLDQKQKGGQAQQAKHYPNLCGSKQEAAILPAGSGQLPLTCSKKSMDWSCALCQISTTSKGGLDEHLQGKKHKAKEEELLGDRKMCSNSTLKNSTESRDSAGQEIRAAVGEESVKANKTVVGLDQKVEGEEDSENKNEELPKKKVLNASSQKTTNGIPTGETMKRKLPLRENFEFWCEVCQVGTRSAVVMEGHQRGNKHMAWSNESRKNNEAIPLTTSTTIVTPPEPAENVEDEDVVAEESNEETADCAIEIAEDEEVVVYTGRQSWPYAADSLLC